MNVVFYGASNPQIIKSLDDVKSANRDFVCLGFIDNDPGKQNRLFGDYVVLGGDEVLKNIISDDVYFVNTITRNMELRYERSEFLSESGCKALLEHSGIEVKK